jgi:diacylglycerol O-acyltransferase
MHVGGLQLFSFPEDARDDYVAQLVEHLRSETQVTSPFNQRLTSKFGQPAWTEDEHLDLEHHFRFETLPTPGRIRELLALVSAEHSHLMDRQRPLWEFHLIEGLQD